jgi:ADP-ribosylglycohydrolase
VGSDSAGSGGAMRVTALGALYRDDPDALARVVVESTLVTHAELRAAAIAYAAAWAAAALVRGEPVAQVRAGLPPAVAEIEAIWSEPLGWRVDVSGGDAVSRGLAALFDDLPDDPAAVRERVCDIAAESLDPGLVAGRRTRPHPNGGYALSGGAHALAVGLADAVDPTWALGELVGLGYDTDTAGAIAGGLLGARFGCGWIPVERITDGAAISAWADAVATRAGPAESLDALLAREARRSDEEARFQEHLAAEYDDPWGDLWSPF